jgi:hypothetical protein
VKLFLAGLFVFVGLAAGALGLEALGVLETRGPLVGLLMAIVFAVVLALAWWIFREKSPDPRPLERERAIRKSVAAGERLRVDPRLDFRFDFVNTHQDLLDAERALRRERTGIRGWVAACMVLLGLLWLAAFADYLVRDLPAGRVGFAPFAWLLMGSLVIWFFALRPWLARRALRRSNAPAQHLMLRVSQSGLEGEVTGLGAIHRDWFVFNEIVPTPKGVLLVVLNEWHWIPRRAFASDAERERFVETVVERMAQEMLRSEEQPKPHSILPDATECTLADVRSHWPANPAGSFIELTLRRGASEKRLRFLRPTDVELDAEAIRRGAARVQILALPFPELGGPSVTVFELREEEEWEEDDDSGFPRVGFYADDVIDLDAAGSPPPHAAAPVSG